LTVGKYEDEIVVLSMALFLNSQHRDSLSIPVRGQHTATILLIIAASNCEQLFGLAIPKEGSSKALLTGTPVMQTATVKSIHRKYARQD